MSNWETRLKERTEETQSRVLRRLPAVEGVQKELLEAMCYSVENGGKRIRPMLIQETYRYLGGKEEYIETLVAPFMAAMEMIHSYSLVHDDLPAMDNDDYRRGKLTTHKRYGHAMGILAGDALLNFAYETALCAGTGDANVDATIVPALRVLAGKAGAFGMVGGQSVDVMKSGSTLTEEELGYIHQNKTGALLEASMMIGAILAQAPQETVDAVERVAAGVGLAFQIQDDILDVTSTTEELGKPVHSDEKNAKTTYVTLHGLEESRRAVAKLSAEATELLCQYGAADRDDFLPCLIASLVNRTM